MKEILRKTVAVVVVPLLLIFYPAQLPAVIGQEGSPLALAHIPLKKAKVNETIPVNVSVESKEGVELVRLYFRAKGTDRYFFVPMIITGKSQYFGLLPAPDGSRRNVEYLFLIKTFNNRIFTSQLYTATVKAGRRVAVEDSPDVLVETRDLPAEVPGFDKKVKIRQVTSYEKHGVLAGLYKLEDAGGSGSTGHYHGTVLAKKDSGLSPLLITGGVLAGVAVVALVAGGGGGSSSSGNTAPDSEQATGAGSWTLNYTYGACLKSTSQAINCSEDGLVTAVSPTAVGIPLPEDCANSPFAGLADVFVVGGSCDSVTACEAYSSSDLVSRSCETSAMVFYREDGTRIESWSK